MKFNVGITDMNWFRYLKTAGATEVNFWLPGGGTNFKALPPGGLFLFKLHKRDGGKIAGGGFFVRYEKLPMELAWSAFGDENGCPSLPAMKKRIMDYRASNGKAGDETSPIGCTILEQTFYFDEKDWIDSPADWKDAIVSRKGYDTADEIGAALYEKVMLRLRALGRDELAVEPPAGSPAPAVRLAPGSGIFRLLVAESYGKRCAVTGMDAVPALVAAHIKPVSAGGENVVPNGLFLRADLGALFSRGYLTVGADDLRVRIARAIPDLYSGGAVYRTLDGHRIDIPSDSSLAPARDLLDWHNRNVFVA